ncbi:hypothetical protein Psi01_45530 [Planobispora siamensis]|uniref:Uncharacterized protein n=1 Tax=Planobispora siamensis TaxID=936338 RepID=A0A8J3SGM3_9ACTN|nr:hypothetical protein Psi01_45530 [Planobispora siamensis]
MASEMINLSEEIAEAKDELRVTREQLTANVIARISATREEDSRRFSAVEEEPSHTSLMAALARADRLGLISEDGCRVELFDTDLYVRFVLLKKRSGDDILLKLEKQDGSELNRIRFTSDKTAEDVLIEIAELTQAGGFYPGDAAFDPGRIFSDLRKLLEIAHSKETGANGVREPLGRVVQLYLPQWAITDNAIVAIRDTPYRILLSRLREIDWLNHVNGKSWVDAWSFSQALATAEMMFEAGNLATKPPEWRGPQVF